MRRPLLAAVCLALLASSVAQAQGRDPARAAASGQLSRVEQLLGEWNVEGAKEALEALSALMPRGAEPFAYFRGRIAFEEGRYPEAVELLEAAGIEDREGSYLRLAKDTHQVVKGHHKLESEHFILYYPPGKDEVLAPYALEALEAIRAAMLADLGYAPPGKVRVEVVNNARELSRISTLTHKQIQATGTIAICKYNKLMVTSPKAVLRGYDWLDTLAHEYVHLVVSRKARNKVPIWLHEGLAKFLESRWRGAPGLALSPSTQALLGARVKQNKLIPFEKMHPSIALLPTAEDAAVAFAEVFYAIDLIHREKGTSALRALLESLSEGADDKRAVEQAMGQSFPAFERSWLQHVRRQKLPKELLPLADKKVLKEDAPGKGKGEEKQGKEISFGEFAQVSESQARRFAHLGELLRERGRMGAAAAEYQKAHREVGDKYEAISNKFALALLELGRLEEAERVLVGSLKLHPGIAATHVHLGRIYLAQKDLGRARGAFRDALAVNPFDPEVHVSLFFIHSQRGEKALAERTRKAAAQLTGLPAERISELASRLAAARNLGEVPVPSPPEPTR
jgi:tetratricopeptide (TPR) repeat protein